MSELDNIAKIVAAVVAALGGAGGIAAIIKQLVNAATVRSEAKKISEDGHKKTQKQLGQVISLLQDQLAAAQETARAAVTEAAALREERNALIDKNSRLESKNERLTAALPAQATAKEKEKV